MEDRAGLGTEAELAALTARVAELERAMAALGGFVRGAVAPPPPMPVAAAAGLRGGLSSGGELPRIAPPAFAAAGVEGPVASGMQQLGAPVELPRIGPAGKVPFAAAAKAVVPAKSLEDRLGAQVFNLVGILALVIATAYGLKLAIEHGLIGPLARVLIGIVAGVAAILLSERLRAKGMAAYSYSLKAVGSAVLYLVLWAAFQVYHLPMFPGPVALGLMVLVTAWNAYMAYAQDAELLAAYALAGGFLTPLLLSTGGNHEGFLLMYIGAIDLAVVWLMRVKPWRRLLIPTFLISSAYFFGWYARYYYESQAVRETAAFIAAYFAIWAVLSVRGWMREDDAKGQVVVPVLMPLLNAVFTGVALFVLLADSGLGSWKPWLMVGLAAVYLLLMRVQRTAVASAMHLAMGVVFLTAAIPLKASGHTLTTAWLIEGLVLYWASTRFAVEERAAARVLWGLSAAGYVLGLGSLLAHWFLGSMYGMNGFFNRNLGAAVVAVATLGGAVWLSVREKGSGRGTEGTAIAGLVAIDGVAVLLCLRELAAIGEDDEWRHAAFTNSLFATALLGLALLAAVAYVAMRLRTLHAAWERGMELLAAGSVIGFNLLAILCVESEISQLWQRSTNNLQRSLAISGFLLLYGSGLLAIGFVRRSAFVRWQGLVLLLFTICKIFLYDISELSAGYRVASFMGLGAVLMGISYAYQKDWLGLKDATPAAEAGPAPPPPAPPDSVPGQGFPDGQDGAA